VREVSAGVRRRRFFAVLFVVFLFGPGVVLLKKPEVFSETTNLFGLLEDEPAEIDPEPRPDGLDHDLDTRLDAV